MGEGGWRSTNGEWVHEVPDLQLGQAGSAPITPIRNDRENGSSLQAGDDDRQIHPRVRFIITGNREGELCGTSLRNAEHSQNDNHQDIALKVFLTTNQKICVQQKPLFP
jgi:hypothetical protein